MSRSTLLRVYKSKACWDVELSNGHGTAPVLWDYLQQKYLPEGQSWITSCREVWKLFDSPGVSERHKLGLLLTFDRSVLLKKHLLRSVAPLKELAAEMTGFCSAKQWVNHWPAVASFVEAMAAKKDYRMIGIAINCTSVADVWDDYPLSLSGKNSIKCDSGDLFKD